MSSQNFVVSMMERLAPFRVYNTAALLSLPREIDGSAYPIRADFDVGVPLL